MGLSLFLFRGNMDNKYMPPRYAPPKLKRKSTYGRNEIHIPVDSEQTESITDTVDTVSESENNTTDTTPIRESATQNHDEKNAALNPNHIIGYDHVVKILRDTYHFDENMNSTALDILALYLRGQKIIYMESKTYCESRLNSLMIPAILISAACSILNYILKDVNYGTIIISGLNAFNSFILTIINYLKLAEKSQNHLIAAQRFHNLEARLELQSGRSLFFSNSEEIEYALEEMEKEIKEIQSSDQFLVPEEVRYRYPNIFASNIFASVKEIKNKEIIYINTLKTAVQKIYEHTKKRDELIARKADTTKTIISYKEELREKEVDLELSNAEMAGDNDFKETEQKIEEYALVLHNNILHTSINQFKSSLSEDDIAKQVKLVEPPPLQLPESNLGSEELYSKISLWKERYDDFLSKRKELYDDFSDQYEKIKEKYDKDTKQKDTIAKILSLKIETKHLTKNLADAEKRKENIKEEIKEQEHEIHNWDAKKDAAFNDIVQHRQRYINLSDDMDREIERNINDKKKWYNCSPYNFFNT
jgi:hypothetical protein